MLNVLRGGERVSIASTSSAYVPGMVAELDSDNTAKLCASQTGAIGVFFDDSVTEVSQLNVAMTTVMMGSFEGLTDQYTSGIAYSNFLGVDTSTGMMRVAQGGDVKVARALNTPSSTTPLHFFWHGACGALA